MSDDYELSVPQISSQVDPRCNCCDPVAPRMLDQTGARYNDQSANNLISQQQNFILQQQSAWMQLSNQTNQAAFNTSLQQIEAIKRLLS